MNKLGAALFSVLLLCGALLWVLAPESFNQYIKQEIETLSAEVTKHTITAEKVHIQAEQGTGEIANLILADAQGNQLITVGQIIISLNPKSLKSDTLIVNQLDIKEITFSEQAILTASQILDTLKKTSGVQNDSSAENSVYFLVKKIKLHQLTLRHTGASLQTVKEENVGDLTRYEKMTKSALTRMIFTEIFTKIEELSADTKA